MKKSSIVVALLCLLVPIVLLVVSNSDDLSKERAFYVLQGMKFNTITGGNSAGLVQGDATPLINPGGNNIEPILVMPSTGTPEGVSAGYPGYGLDMMYLMSNTNPASPEALRAKELIELYFRASQGELDDAALRLEASVYAAMHSNETSSSTFLDGYYGKANNIYAAQEMVLSKFTSEMRRKLGVSGTSGVWKDAGTNPDGYPDGPFQILSGAPAANIGKTSTINTTGIFDIYFFPDNLSWINYDFSKIAKDYNTTFTDTREAGMLASAKHNRGSIDKQAWGVPYNVRANPKSSTYVTASASETYEQARVMFVDIMKMFDEIKPSLVGTDNSHMRALGSLLLFRAGWYAEAWDGMPDFNNGIGMKYFDQIFGTVDLGGKTRNDWLKDTYLKKPWDIMKSKGIEITASDFYRIYGMDGSYNNYYPGYAFLYKIEDYTSSCYKNKMADGSDPPVVHAWDILCVAHSTGSGLLGESVLLKLFINAGMPTNLEGLGAGVIDPTNPSTAYRIMNKDNPNSYNPSVGEANLANKFNQLLGYLDLRPSPGRMLTIYSQYTQAGTKYWYGGGGIAVSTANYEAHKAWVNQNNGSGLAHLNGWHYSTTAGKAYEDGKTADLQLRWGGKRLYDCTMFCMSGLSLGITDSKGYQMFYALASSQVLPKIAEIGNDRVTIKAADGIEYDITLLNASGAAHTLKEYLDDPKLVPGGLKSGDVLVSPDNHSFTYLGIAQKAVKLPADVARGDKEVAIQAGDVITLEAWISGEYNRVTTHWINDANRYYVIRTPMMDDISVRTEFGAATAIKGVTYIGDSIGYGSRAELRSQFIAKLGFSDEQIVINSVPSRSLTKSSDSIDINTSLNGVSVYSVMKDSFLEYVVVELGTNGWNLSSDIKAIDDLVNSLPSGRKMVLVTPYVSPTYNGSSDMHLRTNAIADHMRDIAAKHDFVVTADWNEWISDQGDNWKNILADGVHLTAASYVPFVSLITEAMKSGSLKAKP